MDERTKKEIDKFQKKLRKTLFLTMFFLFIALSAFQIIMAIYFRGN